MHLSALRIRGFKSFADPVELRFFPGVAVVVGPNGSGKSNIADAIQWAMSSQPPSQLRVQSGQDVLFAGSQVRPPSGLCEVELILQNDDGRLSLPHAEVSVMRRQRRESEGEYQLNRSAVRRLEILETLADAGLGRELHCVVTQGSVDQILLARPEERRDLVEEAAGLGKYKRRRRRAQQKLAHVRADLERAADVEREIRARLRPLELQATAAERAEKLAREIAQGRLRLLASDGATARQRRAQLQELVADLAAERTTHEGLAAVARARRATAEGELATLASAQEAAAVRSWGLAAALERLAERRGALAERLEDVSRDERRERERAVTLEREAADLSEVARAASAESDRLSAESARLEPYDERALDEARARSEAALARALDARRAAAEADGGAARVRSERDGLQAQLAGCEQAAAGLAAAAEAARAGRARSEQALALAVPAAAAARTGRDEAERSAAEAREASAAARADEAAARLRASQAVEQAAAARARSEALDGALRRADGLAPAVRRLAERGATLAVSLVEAPPGLELAVAAALARRAAGAVADDLPGALELLDGDGLDGASVLVRGPRGQGRAGAPAAAKPLGDLVRLLPAAPPDLLDGVWLVDDASAFEQVADGIAVTREGAGWDASARVAFRSGAAGEAALIAARAERESAREQADRSQREAAAAEADAAVAGEAAAAAAALEAAAAAAAEDALRRLAAGERAEHEARTALERARREEEREELRRAENAAAAERLTSQLAQAGEELSALERAAAEASAAAGSAEGEHAGLAAALEEQRELAAARRAERAALGERRQRARDDAQRAGMAAAAAATAARAAAAAGRALAALAALESAALPVLDACRVAAEQLVGPVREALQRFEHRGSELSAELSECGRLEAEHGQVLRELAGRSTALEVEAAQVDERLADARRRGREIAEQQGLAVVEAVEPLPGDEASALSVRLERLERRRLELGAVNPLARQEYDEQRQRADDVAEQRADLQASLRELDTVIRELSATISERFAETFAEVERGFGEIAATLFPGGRGRVVLTRAEPAPPAEGEDGEQPPEPAEAPEPGIELEVQPAGKKLASMSVLSGGERALAALAFLFALLMARPSPFYVLDEVDAALDDANIARFLELVDRYRERAQFIVITHQKQTMDVADVLYGVSMAGDGISKVLSRRVARETVAG